MLDKILEIISIHLGIAVEDLNDEMAFADIGIDSLTLMKIIMSVENTFDIQINDDDTITVSYAYNDYNQKQPWFSEDKMNIKLVEFEDDTERIFKIV